MANHIGILLDIIQVYMTKMSQKTCYRLMELVISSFTAFPSILKKNLSRAERALDLIILMMANIDKEVPCYWLNPGHDFSEMDM